MGTYKYYLRNDPTKESVGSCYAFSRLNAAKTFAFKKHLTLKDFLRIWAVTEKNPKNK